jgi:hypothetical protein
LFLALDHDATFIARGAEAGLAINAVTMIFCLTYVTLAQRRSAIVSIAGAVAVWIVLAALEGLVTWTLLEGLLANAVAFAICIPLFRRFQYVEKLPQVAHYWYDIPLRATMVAALVAIVVSSSHWVGAFVSGAIALFPTVLFSMMLILHARIGGKATAAMIANGGWAMMGFGLAIAVLQVTAIPFGSALALTLALVTSVVWNLALWRLGPEK